MANHSNFIRNHPDGGRLLAAFFLMAVCIFAPAKGFAFFQDEKVSLKVKDMPLREFVEQVRKSSTLDIVYASEDIDKQAKVTYSCKGKTVIQVLSETLHKYGLNFKIDKGIITIYKKTDSMSSSSSSKANPMQPIPSMKTISGKVTDAATGEALPGVPY